MIAIDCYCLSIGALAIFAPGSQGVLCLCLGLTRYILRPKAPILPGFAALSEHCLSPNYLAWAKGLQLRVDAGASEVKSQAELRFPLISSVLSWSRGPGLEAAFCSFWSLHAASHAYLDIVLEDIPRLDCRSETREGRSPKPDRPSRTGTTVRGARGGVFEGTHTGA